MRIVVGSLLILATVWLAWVPWTEYRHSLKAGAHRIPFSRMLMRLSVAGCILAIGLFILLSGVILRDRSKLFELLYWMGALFFACLMLVAGVVDYLLVRRDLLMGQREIVLEAVRSVQEEYEKKQARENPMPTENGHRPSPET